MNATLPARIGWPDVYREPKSCRTRMSAECPRAAARRCTSIRSAEQPCCARWAFVSFTARFSAETFFAGAPPAATGFAEDFLGLTTFAAATGGRLEGRVVRG